MRKTGITIPATGKTAHTTTGTAVVTVPGKGMATAAEGIIADGKSHKESAYGTFSIDAFLFANLSW